MGKIVISRSASLSTESSRTRPVTRASGSAAGSARSGQGPRSVEQGRARRGAGRRGPAAGSAQLRVLRRAVAIPEWRVGGQVEQPAQVRRVLDPRRSRLEQLDGAEGRRGERGLEAEAGARRGNRRPCQLPARAHADRARPRRRAAAGDLSRSCSGPASASSARPATRNPCASSTPRPSSDGLAFLTYQPVRDA